jgi:pimeloyl-ACP methyl ester carboxylesterase
MTVHLHAVSGSAARAVAGNATPARAVAGNATPMPMDSLARPRWLPESVWPFRTSSLHIEDMRIAVTDVGEGPVLLFVHTGFWSFIWRDVITRLSADYRCVCFDAPGTGRSERLNAGSISLERAARTLTGVIEQLDLNDITLVFHDLGGPSGIAGALPVSDRVRGLCAVNTFAWRPTGGVFRGMLALVGSTRRVSRRHRPPGRALVPQLHARRTPGRSHLHAPRPRAGRPVSHTAAHDHLRRAQRSARVSAALEGALSRRAAGGGGGRQSLSHVRRPRPGGEQHPQVASRTRGACTRFRPSTCCRGSACQFSIPK